VDLDRIFSHELGDILSVVAQDVQIHIEFADGITPVRAIGRDAAISGRSATLAMNQLYAQQEKHVVFEVKVPPGIAGNRRALADIGVSYANMINKQKASRRGAVSVEFSAAQDVVAARRNARVMENAVEAIATEENRRALALRDAGRVREAQVVLDNNATYLNQNAVDLGSSRLRSYGQRNSDNARSLGSGDWARTRKDMRDGQISNQLNRGW
jgi:Ca-activated chloride channel homolog